MTINFPNSPSINDQYTYNTKVYVYDGTKWVYDPTLTNTQLNTANDTTTVTLYPTMVAASGVNSSVKVSTSKLSFNALTGTISATSKSFLIDHPSRYGWKLQYGSLEGPENGVYVRGRLTSSDTIKLPPYWKDLVDIDSITVNLTPIGNNQNLYVITVNENAIVIGGDDSIDCFYTVYAERKDTPKLRVEFEGE
jgi:hypothetical protein